MKPKTGLIVLVLLLSALAAMAWPSSGPWQALPRLALSFAVVVVLPGLLLIRWAGWFPMADMPERLALSVSVGYIFDTALSILITLLQLNIEWAAGLLMVFAGAAAFLPKAGEGVSQGYGLIDGTPETDAFKPALYIAVGMAVFIGWYAWTVEPPIMGEETVELISIRKMLENDTIGLKNILHRPDAIPTYIFAPYYFTIALITKISGLSMFSVYVKLRAFYVITALAAFYALARHFLGGRFFGYAAVVWLMALLIMDPDPWSWPASLLPMSRRGSFAAGVLLPGIILMTLHAVGLVAPKSRGLVAPCRRPIGGVAVPPWGLVAPAVMALMMTHALEAVFYLYFLAGLSVALLIKRGPSGSRRKVLVVAGLVLCAVLLYKAVHVRAVEHIARFEHERKAQSVEALKGYVEKPLSALINAIPVLSHMPGDSHYMIGLIGSVAVYSVFPAVLAPLLLFFAPSVSSRILWCSLILPLVLYSTPLGMSLLRTFATGEAVHAGGYFSLFGLMAFMAAVSVGLRRLDNNSSGKRYMLSGFLVLLGGLFIFLPVCWGLAWVTVKNPSFPAAFGLAFGITALILKRKAGDSSPKGVRNPGLLFVMSLFFIVPVFVGMKRFPMREFPDYIPESKRTSMFGKLLEQSSMPSVLNWPEYYPYFQERTNPKIDIPWETVGELRGLLPPQSALIYDPGHSYGVPLLFNVYIVNPGHLLSTDMDYFEKYVKVEGGAKTHPVFNERPELSREEREFLRSYKVRYILVNPAYYDAVVSKLAGDDCFQRVYDKRRFLLYEVGEDCPGAVDLGRPD